MLRIEILMRDSLALAEVSQMMRLTIILGWYIHHCSTAPREMEHLWLRTKQSYFVFFFEDILLEEPTIESRRDIIRH
ncbi:hypothetical protein AO716_06525 [Arthrobacter sp. Edens01]|nr:hypothetical protein AO716_06525 [Arthrobacter sp. Edens01]